MAAKKQRDAIMIFNTGFAPQNLSPKTNKRTPRAIKLKAPKTCAKIGANLGKQNWINSHRRPKPSEDKKLQKSVLLNPKFCREFETLGMLKYDYFNSSF